MPKHRPQYQSKPASTPPAYFASATSSSAQSHGLPGYRHRSTASHTSFGTNNDPNTLSVNELLSHLRSSQVYSNKYQEDERPRRSTAESAIPRSVPPPLQQIFGAEPTPPPRPRIRPGVSRRAGRIPGPAPPASWLTPQPVIPEDELVGEDRSELYSYKGSGSELPGLPESSLKIKPISHQLLVALARNWPFHIVYDQFYLYSLPASLKAHLLSYIARYSPSGVTLDGFRVMFAHPEDIESAAAEETTHLDLSRGLGSGGLGLKALIELFTPLSTAEAEGEEILESWDTVRQVGVSRFMSLTHLSLAYPREGAASWTKLIALAKFMPALTYLSLSGWGTPSDNVVRRLSRRLLGLKWLEVSDCPASVYDALQEAEWTGAWRGVETVVARQAAGAPTSRVHQAKELCAFVRSRRRGGTAGKWLELIV